MKPDEKLKLFRPAVGSRGMTELHYAAYCGDQNALVAAIEQGLDPNARDEYRGYTAAHWLADMAAAGGPRVQMLRLLVTRGADIRLRAATGDTVLSLATAAGSATGDQLSGSCVRLERLSEPDA